MNSKSFLPCWCLPAGRYFYKKWLFYHFGMGENLKQFIILRHSERVDNSETTFYNFFHLFWKNKTNNSFNIKLYVYMIRSIDMGFSVQFIITIAIVINYIESKKWNISLVSKHNFTLHSVKCTMKPSVCRSDVRGLNILH